MNTFLICLFAGIIFVTLQVVGFPVGKGITGAIAGGLGYLLAYIICPPKDEEGEEEED